MKKEELLERVSEVHRRVTNVLCRGEGRCIVFGSTDFDTVDKLAELHGRGEFVNFERKAG
jgi:hypothetical protein